MLNDLSTPAAFVATRRSGKPREMVAPGPDAEQIRRILAAAMRVPDHGKIAPWRFVVIAPEARDAFAALLQRAWRAEHGADERPDVAAIEQFARQAPAMVIVLSTPDAASKIPVWEQELSAGAAVMNLLAATHAEGFVGGWLTGWAAYSPTVVQAFAPAGARIAGFVFIGTAGKAPEERPRPDYDAKVSYWRG